MRLRDGQLSCLGGDQGAAHDYSFAGAITPKDDAASDAANAADASTADAIDVNSSSPCYALVLATSAHHAYC